LAFDVISFGGELASANREEPLKTTPISSTVVARSAIANNTGKSIGSRGVALSDKKSELINV
jgi:hypothetical protein